MTRRSFDPGDRDAPMLPRAAPVTLAAYDPSHETALAALLADDEVRNSLCAGLAPGAASAVLIADWTSLSGPDAMLWVVTDHEQAVVGAVRFDRGDLAYFIARRCWGQGFGRAAARIAVALIGAETTVRAVIDRNNGPSLRIVEGAGFRFAGLADQPLPRARPAARPPSPGVLRAPVRRAPVRRLSDLTAPDRRR